MFETGQNWELFGYDTRNLGRYFSAAWKDLLWAYDSPVRERLDEAVTLRTPDGAQTWQAGIPCAGVDAACRAVLLPDDLVLSRHLRLPLAVEADLEDALALEAAASSPFAADDTGTGWLVTARDEHSLHVQLVVVSLSAAMAYIGETYGSHAAHAQEVWVAVGERMVVVRGFGEEQRKSLYRRRLLRVTGMLGLAAALLLVIPLVGAGFKKWELERLDTVASTVRSESAQAMRARSSLGQANEIITAVGAISAAQPDVHTELARLTHILGDGVYLERLSFDGMEIELRGKAENAAEVMELLIRQPGYAGVTAASPIRKLPGTNLEQFHLKVQISGGKT